MLLEAQTSTHTLTFSLTPLRFVCEATTPLRLEESAYRAGNNLRGALGNVMQRAYCAGDRRDPAHAATCPVCWLLAANEHPGQERRGYTLTPPRCEPALESYQPGERFEFGLTLFGGALRFLPYFILAVPEMGRMGVGAGRGKFALKQVWTIDPFDDERECLLAEGEALVHTPKLTMTDERVRGVVTKLETSLASTGRLTRNYLTPMRLIQDEALLKAPDFGVLFARLLKRLDELEEQFGNGRRRPFDEVQSLHAGADRVRLVESGTRWVEVRSGSTRSGQPTWLSGFVGSATYSASLEIWRPLLPWLVWGQLAQVGKDTVKGNGIYEIVG